MLIDAPVLQLAHRIETFMRGGPFRALRESCRHRAGLRRTAARGRRRRDGRERDRHRHRPRKGEGGQRRAKPAPGTRAGSRGAREGTGVLGPPSSEPRADRGIGCGRRGGLCRDPDRSDDSRSIVQGVESRPRRNRAGPQARGARVDRVDARSGDHGGRRATGAGARIEADGRAGPLSRALPGAPHHGEAPPSSHGIAAGPRRERRGLDAESPRVLRAIHQGRDPSDGLDDGGGREDRGNAYWDVQIAFANEVALISEELGVDAYRVRDLVNTCPYRMMLIPGAGVGGHCIPKDSWLLVSPAVQSKPELIPTAREVNDFMPRRMARIVEEALAAAGRKIKGARVAVLGFSYRENTDDTRNSPAKTMIQELRRRGADIAIHDPFARSERGYAVLRDIKAATKGADCIALVTAHDAYRKLDLKALGRRMRHLALVDGRNLYAGPDVVKMGFVYRGIGKGQF